MNSSRDNSNKQSEGELTSDYNFELPPALIAQSPPADRGKSRLMVMERKSRTVRHYQISELTSLLERGTLMVFNNSRVRKARLFGTGANNKTLDFLLIDEAGRRPDKAGQGGKSGGDGQSDGIVWRVLIKKAGKKRIGSVYQFNERGGEKITGEITDFDGEYCHLKFDRSIDDAWLDANGHIPLPPYIKREDSTEDAERYQTVYAESHGSSAAPTAGLHFTEELLAELESCGIERAFVTLHVGPGTFLPVRSERISDHRMHSESYTIDNETAEKIEKAKKEGRMILPVGTTSVRTLESAAIGGEGNFPALKRGEGNTDIFIKPGYKFNFCDALFTNFHTPESTLIMLVSALAGRDFVLSSYREAVREGYRFFSYGDACLIL